MKNHRSKKNVLLHSRTPDSPYAAILSLVGFAVAGRWESGGASRAAQLYANKNDPPWMTNQKTARPGAGRGGEAVSEARLSRGGQLRRPVLPRGS